MANFITVRCADGVDVLVNVDDISSVKPAKVYVDKSSDRTVDGCLIERKSTAWTLWCIQPFKQVARLMEDAGATFIQGRP